MGGETIPGPSKSALDAATDQAVMICRSMPLDRLEEEGAAALAEGLSAQFPGSPDVGRVLVALAQHLAFAGVFAGGPLARMTAIIGVAGARLCGEAQSREPIL